MLAYWPFLVAVLAGGAAAPDTADHASFLAAVRAERDFDQRRGELGLIGSAPFYGVGEPAASARRDFEQRRDELGLVGSAPFYGMDETGLAPASEEETTAAGR